MKKVIPEGLDGIENFKYEPVVAKMDGRLCCIAAIHRWQEQNEEAARVRHYKVQEKTYCATSSRYSP